MVKMKKAQIKTQQMIVMLIAIFVLFSIVILFFSSIFFSGIKSQAKSLEQENSLMLVSRIANSPEFSCGGSFDKLYENCIDFDKAFILSQKINNYLSFYYDSGSIRIEKVYPKENNLTCNKSNYPNCSNLIVMNKTEKKAQEVFNFVLLCKKQEENKCWLARIIVSPLDNS